MHVGYDDLKNDPATVIANAKALGVKWVGIAWYPHDGKAGHPARLPFRRAA